LFGFPSNAKVIEAKADQKSTDEQLLRSLMIELKIEDSSHPITRRYDSNSVPSETSLLTTSGSKSWSLSDENSESLHLNSTTAKALAQWSNQHVT